MDAIKTDLADQQASLSEILNNTEAAKDRLYTIDTTLNDVRRVVHQTKTNTEPLEQIELNTSSIKTSSSNTATATSSLNSAVGTTTDASTSNTVIGLLKSIANKLS